MISYLEKLIDSSPGKLITYREYMEAVLYHPTYGYYMKEKQKIGREGDFITTSNISDIFGRLVAKWFAQLIQQFSLNPVFCEVGGGNGRFARAFLEEWRELSKQPIQYIIVESSPFHRKLQKELLYPDFSVIQTDHLLDLSPFEGVIFSNELFDALPVHVIEKENGNLYEVMVGMRDGSLFEQKLPLGNQEIFDFLHSSRFELEENQRLEIPLFAGSMLAQFTKILTKGFVVTVDYGYSNEEWMDPSRKNGSLRGYFQHQMVEDVLLHPGEMDITSHVHFDWLRQKGEELELNYLATLRQDDFLLKAGILKELENHYDPNPFSEISKRNRAIRSLIMPSGISSYFHFLLQKKNIDADLSDLFLKNE